MQCKSTIVSSIIYPAMRHCIERKSWRQVWCRLIYGYRRGLVCWSFPWRTREKGGEIMDGNSDVKALADALWVYFQPKVLEMMQAGVSFYRAQVVAEAGEGGRTITVQKPMDSTRLALPFVPSAQELKVGDQALVLVFGSPSNAIVLGDGVLGNL